ncbi:MAG: pectinesterase family protein [Brotaphodocola sp.]
MIQNTIFHIAQDGTGDFTTISDALLSLSSVPEEEAVTFYIHKGIYKEQLTITRPYLTFVGESADQTILTYSLYAKMPSADIGKLGTFRSYSCLIDTHDFTARNLTFENSSGKGPDVGQALAVYADGDRLFFDNCRFLGGQDTLFTAPLPPREVEPNGFIGPKQFAPRRNGRHHYRNCYLEGDIDFIFGGAAAYFETCEFHSKNIGRPINSYVTAASTPQGQTYGYVMERCRFTGSCPPHSAYLGRPWREYAKTVLLHCEIGEHICEEGWNDWGKTDAHDTIFYAEYKSFGPSSDMSRRPKWVKILSDEEASEFTLEKVLGI